tara:strand:- start:271 stop:489 length:219 start_codon:yes stop_codon:yes gene_type:complete
MRQKDVIIMKNKIIELERNIRELEEQRVYLSKRIKDYGDLIALYKELRKVQEEHIKSLEDKVNYLHVHHEIP